jgi:hypothetical protein
MAISIRAQTTSAPCWRPFPWSRYSPDDLPRTCPLPVCPAQKCRRAKACLAARKGLYCQRTHFANTEGTARTPQSDMDKYIAAIPRPPDNTELGLRMDYLNEIADLRRMETRENVKLWKAGAFGEACGPYRANGVMKAPPPKVYAEGAGASGLLQARRKE